MGNRESTPVLSRGEVESVIRLCNVAKMSKSVLTLNDLLLLTMIDATEEELESLWLNNEYLSGVYTLNSGLIIEKNTDFEFDIERARDEFRKSRSRAQVNMKRAERFAAMCRGAELISVAGSTSYQSASEEDDIDFFCVTKTDEMWIFMLKTLILARIDKIARRKGSLCFSCIMDEGWAYEIFASANDPLFARDALTARVIYGSGLYHGLLETGGWMKDCFPRLYELRMRGRRIETHRTRSSGIKRVLNEFLFQIIGRYIRVKSHMLNRRLEGEGRRSSVFTVKVGKGHCIYESSRYRQLRSIYSSGGKSY